jgi:hypothetical protein
VEADGRRFLDFGSGIAVMALGHGHPRSCKALKDQADRLWHTSNLYTVPEQEALAERLVEHTFADTVFFCNSGTEAAELAIKMARKYRYESDAPERTTILTFEGRSTAAPWPRSRRRVGEADQGLRPAPARASGNCPSATTTRSAPPPPSLTWARSWSNPCRAKAASARSPTSASRACAISATNTGFS